MSTPNQNDEECTKFAIALARAHVKIAELEQAHLEAQELSEDNRRACNRATNENDKLRRIDAVWRQALRNVGGDLLVNLLAQECQASGTASSSGEGGLLSDPRDTGYGC